MTRPSNVVEMLNLAAKALSVAESTEQVTDPAFAAYAQGVAEVLSWLAGGEPNPALVELLGLEE